MRYPVVSVHVAVVLLSCWSTQAFAQARDSSARVIEEILVVAQKREQSLQDVPISVNAYTGEKLGGAAITNITELAERVPGFNVQEVNRPATSTTISLRGIGTSGNDAGLEGAVGVIIDGVYRPRSGMGIGDLVDIDRVEILRGPQGTLFGKNTSSGALVIETKDPTYEREGFVEGTFGDYDLARYSAAVNIPLIDERLAVRLSGRLHKRDGFVKDVVTGSEINDRDRSYLLAKVLFEPTDSLSFLLTLDTSETDEKCCQSVRFSNQDGAPTLGLLNALAMANGFQYPVNPTPTRYETSINGQPRSANDDDGASLEVTWNLGDDLELVSVSSYRDFKSDQYNDVDFSGADLVRQGVFFDVESFSQEFRLSGSSDGLAGGVDWMIGAYYSDDDLAYYEPIDIGTDLGPYFDAAFGIGAFYPQQDTAFGASTDQSAKSLAFFTHNIVTLTDRVELVVGLRYTDEEKKTAANPFFNHSFNMLPLAGLGLPFSPTHSYVAKFEDDAFSGNVSLSYEWTENVRTYVSYSQGFKSGGHIFNRDAAGNQYTRNPAACVTTGIVFPAVPPSIPDIYACAPKDPSFDSETVDAYEIGFRSQLIDQTLQLNASLFLAEYDDLQLNAFDGFGFTVQNAGSAETKGIEVDLQWLTPLEGLSLEASLQYVDATFGDEVGSLASGEPVVGGESLAGAPEWSGSLGGSYSRTIGSAVGFMNANYSYRDHSFTGTRVASDGSELKLPSRDSLDASIGVELENGVRVMAYCRNCTDETEQVLIFTSVVQGLSRDSFLNNPREFGVSVGMHF